MPLSLVEGPEIEPISLLDVKNQVLQGLDVDDERLTTLVIPAARERGETHTGRAFIGPQTWDYILDGFPAVGYIEIPKPPLIDITFVKYVDMAGVTQTWASSLYLKQMPQGPRCRRGRIALPFANIWPITLPQMGAVTIRFTCGYGTADHVPALLKSAMLMDCGTLYSNPTDVIMGLRGSPEKLPGGSRDIYWAYRSQPQGKGY